jgi:hypothetical protein
MKKLMLSALALAAMTSVAMAAEPVKLTSSQLDQVAAGNPCSFSIKSACVQSNWTNQVAAAVAVGGAAVAANSNNTNQVQGDRNRTRIQ